MRRVPAVPSQASPSRPSRPSPPFRSFAALASLAVHGALLLAISTRVPRRAQPPTRPAPGVTAIELVAPAPAPVAPTRAAGRSPSAAAAPRPQRARAARSAGRPSVALATTVRIEPASGQGGGGGPGAGDGGGGSFAGRGFGLGAIEPSEPPPAAPPPPSAPEPIRRVSRARPPQLIYPARQREAAAERLFVARLTIDADGFVTGARLVRGVGGARDDQAAGAVWRFRYRPALDDAGRPTSATIDQPFLVE